jgi:hypothetical protein
MLYPYQILALIISALIMAVIGLPVYGIYRLITSRMSEKSRQGFIRILKIIGISLSVLFFVELAICLITEHHVNEQLGFTYITPETPEGEFFIINRVVPGGIMDKSGLEPGDRVLLDGPISLYRSLMDSEDSEMEFPVLRDNVQLTVTVSVPEMKLPLRKLALWY